MDEEENARRDAVFGGVGHVVFGGGGAHLFGGFDVEHALRAFDGDVEGEQAVDAGGEDDVAEADAIPFGEGIGVEMVPVSGQEAQPDGAGNEEDADGDVGEGEKEEMDLTRMRATGSVTQLHEDDEDHRQIHGEVDEGDGQGEGGTSVAEILEHFPRRVCFLFRQSIRGRIHVGLIHVGLHYFFKCSIHTMKIA